LTRNADHAVSTGSRSVENKLSAEFRASSSLNSELIEPAKSDNHGRVKIYFYFLLRLFKMKKCTPLIFIVAIQTTAWYFTFENDISIKSRILMMLFVYIATLIGTILTLEK